MSEVFSPDRLAACPYKDNDTIFMIDFCPLYVESHVIRPGAKGHIGCVWDVAEPCRVKAGKMEFARQLEKLRAVDPRLASNCEFRIAAEIASDQQRRNMRAAGIQ